MKTETFEQISILGVRVDLVSYNKSVNDETSTIEESPKYVG